jgi:alpha,alpha-trehalase
VDLNALLYKYEKDMLAIHETLGEPERSRQWRRRAAQRRRLVTRHHWHSRLGFFFDHDWRRRRPSLVWTLAGFFPLWAGLASREQAERCRRRLVRFEHRGGLAITDRRYSREPGQWDFPNGWAPLHWIVIDGLRRYGFHRDADRISEKWLATCVRGFEATGRLWERYDVVRRRPGLSERYPIQSGFGWTNGVFVRLAGPPRALPPG